MATSTAPVPARDADRQNGLWSPSFVSDDVKRAQAHVSGHISEHRLAHTVQNSPPVFTHRHALFGGMVVHDLAYTMYGGNALIQVPELTEIYLLELNLDGESVLMRKNDELPFKGGELCVLNAGEQHTKRWCSDGRQIIVRLEQTRLNRVLADLIGGMPQEAIQFRSEPMAIDGEIAPLARMLQMICMDLDAPSPTLGRMRAAESAEKLLLELLLETIPNNYSDAISRGAESPLPGYVRRAMNYIDSHLADELSPTDIAAAANIPLRTLQRAFKAFCNTTPMGYLRTARLDYARNALIADAPKGGQVTDIAFASGFNHLSKFAQVYRERFGETPSETLLRNR